MNLRRHRWFVLLTLLALVLSAVVGMQLWQRVQTSSLEVVATEAGRFTNVMTLLRLGLIAGVVVFWRPIIHAIAERYPRSAMLHSQRMAWRWRVLGWWVVLELVLGQELLNRFLAAA